MLGDRLENASPVLPARTLRSAGSLRSSRSGWDCPTGSNSPISVTCDANPITEVVNDQFAQGLTSTLAIPRFQPPSTNAAQRLWRDAEIRGDDILRHPSGDLWTDGHEAFIPFL